MKRLIPWFFAFILFFAGSLTRASEASTADALEEGFQTPPAEARLHAYWWWLNGNVTAEAITRDLKVMVEKGFGGVLIIDAGGANQDGNRQVPAGPLFGSEPWRELFRHALREGKRVNLEMALNIQSGWNLGGPGVTREDAAKILCWSKAEVTGPGLVTEQLPTPASNKGLLQEIAVLAVPVSYEEQEGFKLSASSVAMSYAPEHVGDGKPDTWWVSEGPLVKGTAEWIRLTFDRDREVSELKLTGRPRYGPKTFDVFAVEPNGERRKLATGQAVADGQTHRLEFKPAVRVRALEISVTDAYDFGAVVGRPRNVQIAEWRVAGPGWEWPSRPSDPITRWNEKTLRRPVGGANFDTSFLIPERSVEAAPGDFKPEQVIDVTRFVKGGQLQWQAPAGRWRIYRFGYTVAPKAHVSTSSGGWRGFALDPMDPSAFQRYWDDVIDPLMADAEQVGGNVLRYLHTDSWEIEPFNWTARLPEEFERRCGYDLTPWLPVMAGCVVESREASERFLHDYRKTVAAMVAEGYYEPFLANAHRHGMQVRAESGGPHGVPIDALHCLGMIDVPMSEFWATSWRHRVTEKQRFFVKQPASAAHTYGRKLVAAEGFTTIGPHWQERVWDNLRPNFDHALCEGLNQLVWTLVTCSPKEMGMPGQDMFAGTHFNPNSTWWRQSEGFLSYINRCQWLLRKGLFVADVLYDYGDHAPNFAGLKRSNPAELPPGYDYDEASEYVILERASVKNGRIVLPDGMSYAALVLPPYRSVSLPVLRKLDQLAQAGAVLIGPRADSSSGLAEWQLGDAEARQLIARLWGGEAIEASVAYHDTADWLSQTGLVPDFEYDSKVPGQLDYIHRRAGETDIYFVNNPTNKPVRVEVRFRVKGKVPEFWDPRDGSIRFLHRWRPTQDGRTELSLSLPEFGSGFIVFRSAAATAGQVAERTGQDFPEMKPLLEVEGPWEVTFDPDWFYPDNGSGGRLIFKELVDWTQHSNAPVRYFSGAATYRATFDFPAAAKVDRSPVELSLGSVHEMARVSVNKRELGIAWCPPWRVNIPAGLLREKDNLLEVEVVNFWPNRLIGDAELPATERRTKTNITKFEKANTDKHYKTLMPSGLLGPVRLMQED